MLVAYPGRESGELRNVQPGEAWDPFWSQHAGRHLATAATVNVNRVVWDTLQRLGFNKNGEPLR